MTVARCDPKKWMQSRKEALLFEVSLLGVDYQGAKDKPPAESDASAGTEQDYLSLWPTPHLEEAAFVSAAGEILSGSGCDVSVRHVLSTDYVAIVLGPAQAVLARRGIPVEPLTPFL